jgi:putative ABC transport system permease protein
VTRAGFVDVPPLTPGVVLIATMFAPPGKTLREAIDEMSTQSPDETVQARIVSPGYLRAMGARLIAGTWLDERADRGPAVLVTRAFAEHYVPEGNAVGVTLSTLTNPVTIAGVLDDIHLRGLEAVPERAVFVDARQVLADRRAGPAPPPELDRSFLTIGGSSIAFAARTTVDPLDLLPELRRIARDIDPRLAIDAVAPMEDVVSSLSTRPRFYAVLLSTFGAVAGFIAVIGIYGVLSYVVSQRTKEIGIRMALGAQRDAVLKLVLRQGAVVVAIGVALGVATAAGLTRYLESMLFGLEALDAATFAAVAVAFAAVALLGAYLPARRATAIDPLDALRYE